MARGGTKSRKRLESLPVSLPVLGQKRPASKEYLGACRQACRTTAYRYTVVDAGYFDRMPEEQAGLFDVYGKLKTASLPVLHSNVSLGSLKTVRRRLSGKTHTLTSVRHSVSWLFEQDRIMSSFTLALEVSEVSEQNFERVLHLRGVSAKSFELMTGERQLEETPDGNIWKSQRDGIARRLYDGKQLDRRLGKVQASSPCEASQDYDALFSSKSLIRTRKSRKLVQRAASGKTVYLESREELEASGFELDSVRLVAGEYREESETIRVSQKTGEINRRYFEAQDRLMRKAMLLSLVEHLTAKRPACADVQIPLTYQGQSLDRKY